MEEAEELGGEIVIRGETLFELVGGANGVGVDRACHGFGVDEGLFLRRFLRRFLFHSSVCSVDEYGQREKGGGRINFWGYLVLTRMFLVILSTG